MCCICRERTHTLQVEMNYALNAKSLGEFRTALTILERVLPGLREKLGKVHQQVHFVPISFLSESARTFKIKASGGADRWAGFSCAGCHRRRNGRKALSDFKLVMDDTESN